MTGVTTRFPVLMRSLSPDEVAARTLQAMAERQFIVILPKTFYLALFAKAYVVVQLLCVCDLQHFVALDKVASNCNWERKGSMWVV